ncbi:MAG: hypothetical protein ACRDK4_12155 [Solirubrobacteraceae bacterium]
MRDLIIPAGFFGCWILFAGPLWIFAGGPTKGHPKTYHLWFLSISQLSGDFAAIAVDALLGGFLLALMLLVVLRSDFWPTSDRLAPWLNAVVFVVCFANLIALYASAYDQLAHDSRQCFGHGLTHVEALIVATMTFTNAGSGISPASDECRLLVASQSLVGLVIITVAIASLAARLLRGRSAG